jgi:nucleotidyltransferase/DNA polymerase involved in DNA repair
MVRTLCVCIADFWLTWARIHDNAPTGCPLILTMAGRVWACSMEASLAGVEPGLPERAVAARCPEAHIREVQEEAPRVAWQQLLAALGRFGPLVESPREGLAYLSVSGLERHFRSELALGIAAGQAVQESLGMPGGIGIADGKFAAEAAALWACPGRALVVPNGVECHFLQHLPVGLLPLTAEDQRQLSLLGIQTLEQYTTLPSDAVRSRFGKQGREGWQWAQGIDDRPLLQYPQERCLLATAYFDDPLREQPALERGVRRLLAPLCGTLRREGLACQELQLAVELEKGPRMAQGHVLREPTADLDRLRAIAQNLLVRLPCALQGLTVKLTQITRLEAGRQLDLFIDRQTAAELDSTVVALAARYGDDCFQRARAVRPDALLPERRFMLEQFRLAT